MLKRLLFAAVVLLAGAGQSFGDVLLTNPITGANPNTSNPYTTGQTVFPGLTASGIGRGSQITGTNTNDRYNATGWNSTSFDANDHFTFTLTPDAGNLLNFVNFTYTSQASGTGPISFAFRSSIDNFASDVATPPAGGATVNLPGAQFQNVGGPIIFRIYGWGASSAGGTFSVNEFTVNGTVTAVPEPTSIALVCLAGGSGLFAAYRKRRKPFTVEL